MSQQKRSTTTTIRSNPQQSAAQSSGPAMTPQEPRSGVQQRERGVPTPNLGANGKDLNKGREESKRPARGAKGQVHKQVEDPFAILDQGQPYHEMLEQLRDSFIVYKEKTQHCRIQLRPKQVGEQFKKYYFQPKVPFLEDPEQQKVFRKNLISEVSRLPEPEPLYLMADKMHLDCLETIGDRSNPAVMREDLGRFYMRRTAQLQHKKYKLLIRWANSQIRSPGLDKVHKVIDHHISILQQEQDNCNNRLERLLPDDKFQGADEAERPSPTTKIKHQPSDAAEAQIIDDMPEAKQNAYKEEVTKLYIEKTHDRSINSCIRQDDFEVYMRLKTYNNKINRLSNKLINKVKWLPYLKRFAIWKDSRLSLLNYRKSAETERTNILKQIQIDIQKKIERFGEQDEKAIHAVTERYIFHLKIDEFVSRADQMMNSHVTDIKKPFMLFASNVELKFKMGQLSAFYPELSCNQLDIDNGQQFTYQMQNIFPTEFEQQVILNQFDNEDTGKDPDRQLLDRLIKNLGLSRFEILQEISKYSEKQRRNSILGALGYDSAIRKAEEEDIANVIKSESHEEFSEQNLIRKIKTIEFFTLNELKQKLRHADWLEYVCFEPAITETQKQQNNLLSSSENQIDSMLKGAFDATDVHDQVSINRILEEAAQAHIAKITAMQHKIIQGEGDSQKLISGKLAGTVGLQASLNSAVNPGVDTKTATESALGEMHKASMKRYEHIQNIDQLNLSLVKNYYSLRLLKSRDYKRKLLSLVNYFRAVQRILALDLKEHTTREKGIGDEKDVIEPHFGKDENGRPLSKMASQTGPGSICTINLNRKLDHLEHDKFHDDPVTINCYKYNGLFNPHVLSTCPMLPKYHRTFGRPNLYESLSAEQDRKSKPLHAAEEMKCLTVKRDKILVEESKKFVTVYNEFGQPIIYSEALTDMVALEEELIKIGSYFINQHEYLQASTDIETGEEGKLDGRANSRPSSMIDRSEIAIDLLKNELDFQFAKVKLIEKLLESYEHIYDPLQSVRSLQMIVDIMAQRPRMNMDASFYSDSYDCEIKVLNEKFNFFSGVIELQTDIEKQENQNAFQFQERKVRLVSETVSEEFHLVELHKDQRIGSDELDPDSVTAEQFKQEQKIQMKLENQQAKKDALADIQKKHITEYANEQYTNFAQVLGLPEISMADLAAKNDQKEPMIQDAIREQAFFTKQLEGYPTYFTGQIDEGTNLGLHTGNTGLLDFFESLSVVPKINASLYQGFEQLQDALKPENGLVCSLLELKFIEEARINLREIVDIFHNGGQETETRGQNLIEEDFYMANSDKIFFLMKEFKAQMEPMNLYKQADPLVVSKLDFKSVRNYNFPRINMSEVRESLEANPDPIGKYGSKDTANDAIVRRMIDLARDSSARQLLEKRDRVEQQCDDDDDAFEGLVDHDKAVRSPSMMKMACNMMEVIRLREELIGRISECNVLSQIYEQQCELASKNSKVNLTDSINFNTAAILKDKINIVDSNHGKNKVFGLPCIEEFDSGLSANLDLKSDSCIKALMLDSGLEEIRGILHYQIMQQQLLTVAVLTNQILMDGPQKGLMEIDLLEEGIIVPNTVLQVDEIISSFTDGNNKKKMKSETTRLKQCISKNSVDCIYLVPTRKSRDRETIVKKFTKVQSRILQGNEFKPELSLRILRSYRIKLLHEYCTNVLKEVYLDSMKIQTLKTCNLLRQKATLLPKSNEKLFTLGRGSVMENMSAYADKQLYGANVEERKDTSRVKDILNGQIVNSSLFYIPHSEEIIFTDRARVEQIAERQQLWLERLENDVLLFDQDIKQMVQRPTMLNESFQPGITHLKEMNANSEKSKLPVSVLPQNRVMTQIQAMSGATYKRTEDTNLQMYKVETKSKQKYGYRKVNFRESYEYGDKDIFKLLSYTSLILRIFTLEYLMGRNNTPGRMILEMEQKVLTGRAFWSEVERANVIQQTNQLRHGDHSEEIKQSLIDNETAADRVIEKIMSRKRVWYELSEDMKAIQTKVSRLDVLAKDLPSEKRTAHNLIDLLILQHQASFYHFLNGVENIMEIYLKNEQDEHFYKLMEVRDMATKRRQGMILNLKNGFYVSQASAHPGHINLNASEVDEFAQFMQQYHPVIDERSLVPRPVNMLQRIYGISSDLDASSKDCLMDSWMSDYSNLQNIFYNLDDSSRSQIGTNFPQIDDLVKDYLIYKGLLEPASKQNLNSERTDESENSPDKRQNQAMRRGQNYMSEYLLATVEILSFKIEAAHMQRVLMGWISGEGTIPSSTAEYTKLMRKYEDMVTLRLLQEREHLNNVYFYGDRAATDKSSIQDSNSPQQDQGQKSPEQIKRDRNVMLDPETRKLPRVTFFDRVNEIRAETNVIKRLLDQKMIQIAIQMITNEHSALSAAINFAGSQDMIQEFVHPQQQFASTLLQDVDKLGHLDIVNKLGFVQQFLTRLRNRCTEVDTLTSGPGIVFSMKDFNECISIFCKQALKYSEENLRQRVETSQIMGNQYRHIIYLKDMEIIYYRSKCEQFLRNIDVIVNTKMSAKGNQMIYELDVTNRELRTLKDHYYLMERFMKEEVRKEFQKELSVKNNKISGLQEDFGVYKKKIQTEIQHQASDQIANLEQFMDENRSDTGFTNKHQFNLKFKLSNVEMETPKNYEIILKLQEYIRNFKNMTKMKQVITEEKHQKEMREMELKLTLNSSLWEQLSESQKRESITRQELELTKRNLTHYEKLIERLYIQLEQLNNEKVRLQRYKSSKQKKISELESKMKDLEILENIDLDKILTEMRLRDKKIERLELVDEEFDNRMETQQRQTTGQINNIQKLLEKERDAKNDAFAKLESMRVEMKALEGTDIKNDLWKDKCKELYELSKELELENDGLRIGLKQLQGEKTDVQRMNEQLLLQQSRQGMKIQSSGPISSTEHTYAETGLQSATSRNANMGKPQLRENMILNRKTLVKPLTAKAKSYGQKRTQSGHPGAARHGNRMYQRNMTNAQSYHYERGPLGTSAGQEQMQQTLLLSNTSYPAFSSDVDINSVAIKQGAQTRNLMVGGANLGGNVKYPTSNQNQAQHRYSAAAGQTRMPNLSNTRKQSMGQGGSYAQSTRAMGQTGVVHHTASSGAANPSGPHGVLSSNVIQNASNFTTSGKNSGFLGTMPAGGTGPSMGQMIVPGSGPMKNGARLHTSQGGRATGSRQKVGTNLIMRGNPTQINLNGPNMGIVGNTVQSAHPTNFADSAELDIDSKQIALSSGSMIGMGKGQMSIEQAEYQMHQEMNMQNATGVGQQYTHGEFQNQV